MSAKKELRKKLARMKMNEKKRSLTRLLTKNRLKTAYRECAMLWVPGPNIILSPPLGLSEADANIILAALEAGFAAFENAHD